MINSVFRKAGKRLAHKAVASQTSPGGRFDFRLGFRLLRDRKVPLTAKIVALAIGLAITAVLLAMEIPLEGVLGFFLPVFGLGMDLMIDGVEFLVFPVLFASLLMPHLVPCRYEA